MNIKSLFAYFCLFVFIYEVNFVFIPALTSKQLMEFIGFLLFVTDKKAVGVLYNYIGIFMSAASLIVVALISLLVNNGGQWMYHMVFFSTILNFFGAYFIYRISRKVIDSFDKLLCVIVGCVILQCVLSILFKAIPPLYNFAYSIVWSEGVTDNVEYSIESLYRLVGLGNAVAFSALSTASLGMMSCAYMIVKSENKRFFLYSICLLFIAVVNFLVARTSLLLFALCVGYIILSFYKKHKVKYIVRILTLYGVFFGIILSAAIVILPQDMYLWAFEVFLNMQDGGSGTETGTGKLLYSMATETSFSPMSFIIGDAMYVDPSGGYYGGADIGYYRQILYYGLIGLFCFLSLHYRIIKKCMRKVADNDAKRYFIFLFFSLMIILMKGDTVLVPLFLLLLVMLDFSIYPKYDAKKTEKMIIL